MEKWIEFQDKTGMVRLSIVGGFTIMERCNEFNILAASLDGKSTIVTIAKFKTLDEAKEYLFELLNYIQETL